MKKTIKFLLALILIVLFCVPALASNNYNIDNSSTIEINPPDDSVFTDAQKQKIKNHLTGNENTMTTMSVMCTLFGHSYTVESWSITEHKYYDSSPRCLISHYDVGICSRCDHVKSTLVSDMRVPCC